MYKGCLFVWMPSLAPKLPNLGVFLKFWFDFVGYGASYVMMVLQGFEALCMIGFILFLCLTPLSANCYFCRFSNFAVFG